jgi:hypothetical protein
MAKKKESKTTKPKQSAPTKPVRRPARAPEQPAPDAAEATHAVTPDAAAPAAPPRERTRDPRLPPPGTVIEKRDHSGNVRCKCTVGDDGIRYEGKVYKSLSAAAMAAAKDLGIGGRTQNGYTFWGLSKPQRPAGDPLEALGRAWDRYRERATSAVGAATDENRKQIRDAIDKHADAIDGLRKKVASGRPGDRATTPARRAADRLAGVRAFGKRQRRRSRSLLRLDAAACTALPPMTSPTRP